MEVLKNVEDRYLRYDFTATEIYELSMKLANKTQDKSRVVEEKKSVTSQYKSQLDALDAELSGYSSKVANGYEMRKVECEILYHKPEQGKKTIIRKDTNEKSVEKMTSEEWSLWNQYNEDDKQEKSYTSIDVEINGEKVGELKPF
jgi:hypothetical protein